MTNQKIYDSLVIGGGPAGQSAALYLARFNRSLLVFDRGTSRTLSFELNENYLGFPQGIHSRQLYELGQQQAERFGATFITQEIKNVSQSGKTFEVTTDQTQYQSRSLIFATGVTDLYPNFPDHQDYLGKSLFWCITCDGHKTIGKKIIVVGDTDEAACTAMQFLNYTPDVTLVTNYPPEQVALSRKWRDHLWAGKVEIYESAIKNLSGEHGYVKQMVLASGQSLPVDLVFNLQGAVPNTALACQLGVAINGEGYIETTDEQRTNLPFVYAAGDVTRMFAHQIVTAAHEGSMAAQAANYDLYQPNQRME